MIVRRSNDHSRLRREKVVLLIDEHDETFSGKKFLNGRQYTLINRKKLQVLRYASLTVVGKAGKPVTLAILPIHKGQSRAETVRTLLQIIAPLGLNLDYFVMDGGFASAEPFEELDTRNLKWICRGKWSKKIASTYSSFLQEIGKVKYQVRSFLGSDAKTLLHASLSCQLNPVNVFEQYKTRFKIEHTYRSTHELRIVSSSGNLLYRWALWYFAHIRANLVITSDFYSSE